jgi:phosphoribosyl 1,2-cyclic phosphodiesterase
MSLFIAALNSGSNGNCYYIGSRDEAILIDAGLSCRETESRMRECGLSMDRVRAVFISHEHTDHIRGIEVLSRKYRLPVYITPATLQHSRLKIAPEYTRSFTAGTPVQEGRLQVEAFVKTHDAADPHSFLVSCGNIRIGVFTDIGHVCDQLTHYFAQCHAAFLEANYDTEMLASGPYPYHLKRRISGGKGHLSNVQALELFRKARPEYMSHLFLSHLSRDNNDPQKVYELFCAEGAGTEIIVASRYAATGSFCIDPAATAVPVPVATAVQAAGQLTLF